MCGRSALSLAPPQFRNVASRQLGADMHQTVWIGQALFKPLYNFSMGGCLPIIYYDPTICDDDAEKLKISEASDSVKLTTIMIKQENDQETSIKKEIKQEIKSEIKEEPKVKKEEELSLALPKIHGLHLRTMTWGLTSYTSDHHQLNSVKTLNARAETLQEKPTFKRLLKNQRAILFVEGFYEWKSAPLNTGKKQPYYIHPKEKGTLMCFACLYDKQEPNATDGYNFTVITVEADEKFAHIHDRMPAILTSASDIRKWLGIDPTDDVLSLLKTCDFSQHLSMYEVSDFVNSATNQSAKCIKPLKETQHGKGSLHLYFKPAAPKRVKDEMESSCSSRINGGDIPQSNIKEEEPETKKIKKEEQQV
ncbi:hypothetical protein FDP41_012256 [Naegleria fowleri]|uniref:Embryonic stem cell-specific 5-hydroxymethylcytosine-binding protein n=1 Tax=Naegleria fowleri TaxID=5763 RepID=A0A6A5C8J0_NAEFO|nr:uncharacterized protein FDP41_012256 [Naegleria fowleri]KAF0981599.1 hypothetical protein FDP41_012256 [Naegleria fowleri]CAG4715854.1 unnamed protein product [Naegleria fowleri]